MPDSRQAEWAWYHTLAIGVIVAIGAIVLQVLIWTDPDSRQVRPLSAASAALAGVLIVGAGLQRKAGREHDRTRAEIQRHIDEALDTLVERVELAAAYQVAVEVQKAQRYADDLFERGMKEMEAGFAAMERAGRVLPQTRRRRRRTPRPEDVDRFLSAIDSGDNVVPMPDPRKVKGDDAS